MIPESSISPRGGFRFQHWEEIIDVRMLVAIDHIPIEERSAAEVTHLQGVRIAPDVHAAHPAFDVTPTRYLY